MSAKTGGFGFFIDTTCDLYAKTGVYVCSNPYYCVEIKHPALMRVRLYFYMVREGVPEDQINRAYDTYEPGIICNKGFWLGYTDTWMNY